MAKEINKTISSPINHWIKINRTVNAYLLSLVVLTVAVVVMAVATYEAVRLDAIVVGLHNNERIILTGSRDSYSPTDSDVELLCKRFLELRYSWKAGEPYSTIRNLAPLVSEGLLKKLQVTLNAETVVGEMAPLSQKGVVSRIEVKQDYVAAEIDRVVSMPQGKSVNPIKVIVRLVQGKPNHWNPSGILINHVLEQGQ